MQQINLEGKVWGYNKKTLAIAGYTVVIVGIAFFIGAKYEKSKLASAGLLKNGNSVAVAPAKKAKAAVTTGNATVQPADTVSGSILSKDGKSITIKTSGNLSQVISVSSATTIGPAGTLADLAVGEQVAVKGTKNADGSFSASDIQKVAATNGQ